MIRCGYAVEHTLKSREPLVYPKKVFDLCSCVLVMAIPSLPRLSPRHHTVRRKYKVNNEALCQDPVNSPATSVYDKHQKTRLSLLKEHSSVEPIVETSARRPRVLVGSLGYDFCHTP